MTTFWGFDENNCFDVRLDQSQIDLIVSALKSMKKNNDEKDMLIDMFKTVEKDTLNSFVD